MHKNTSWSGLRYSGDPKTELQIWPQRATKSTRAKFLGDRRCEEWVESEWPLCFIPYPSLTTSRFCRFLFSFSTTEFPKIFVQIFNFLKLKRLHIHTTAPFFNISKFWHSRINIQDALPRETRCFVFFGQEISPKCKFKKIKWQNIWPHLDSDFSLVNNFWTSFLTI
jgi:hypothetical protein